MTFEPSLVELVVVSPGEDPLCVGVEVEDKDGIPPTEGDEGSESGRLARWS